MTNANAQADLAALRERLRVQLALRIEGARLVVEAALTNGTAEPVHVFNVLWDYAPTGAIAGPDSPAYVCIEGEELRLACRRLPYPASRKMIVAIDPFLSRLDAGAVMRQQLSFDTPVQEYSCYFRRHDDSPVEIVKSARARFIYGIAAGGGEGAFVPAPIEGAVKLLNPTRLAGIVNVESPPVECTVAVARRTDSFERF